MILDGKDLILGRLATVVAKKLMLGEEVTIVNCEKVMVTGKWSMVLQKYKQKKDRGIPLKGPYFPRLPDRLVKRSIRGMIPYKQPKGKDAFTRLKCHIGIPKNLEGEKFETLQGANISRIKHLNYLTMGDIAKFLGASYGK
jgi:large subunit ribosomal protein L13